MTNVIKNLTAHIISECKSVDREERFNTMLDECYSFENVGGPFASMLPSRVLLECDPIAHRCGVNDYADGEAWTEIEGDYYDDSDVESARSEFVSELESEASSIESEIEELEQEDKDNEHQDDREGNEAAILGLITRLSGLRQDITESETYRF